MNAEKFSEAFGNVRDGYIAEADAYLVSRGKKRNWIKLGITAAAFCLAAGGTAAFCYKLEHPYPTKEIALGSFEENSSEFSKIPHWEEMQIYEQYTQLTVNGQHYSARGSEIPAKCLGGALGSVVAAGSDTWAALAGEEAERYCNAEIYEIAGISPECALAVRYEGTDICYAAVNSYYQPETMGKFIEDLDLRNTLVFNFVEYRYQKPISKEYTTIYFENPDSAKVWEMLLSNPAAVNEYDLFAFDKPQEILDISVDVPLLGYKNISISIREDGYIITNILDTGKQFYIGEEHTLAFVDYVLKECEGYEYVWPEEDLWPEMEAVPE